jgi:hypothetical protein
LEPRWKKALSSGLALCVFLLVLARTLRQVDRAPALNWDLVPAMALALSWEVADPLEVQRLTYEHARAELLPETFAELTAPGVRAGRYQDPAAFHEHLAFYRARVLYTLPVYLAWKLGSPLAAATWRVPLCAFALSAGLFVLWASRRLPLALAALFALGLAHTPGLLKLSGYSTADGVAVFLLCLGAFLLVERRSFAAGALSCTLSILARPDGVILVAFLALALFLCDRERPRPRLLAGWLALSALAYLGLQRFAGEYGWWPVFTVSFDEKSLHPAQLPTQVDWTRYGEILARQLGAIPGDGYFGTPRDVTGSTLVFAYAGFALAGLALWRRAPGALGREAALLFALLAAYLVRYFLFPQLWDRFFAPLYALVPLVLLTLVARSLEPGADRPR